MKFREIESLLRGIPYTQPERGRQLYEYVISNKPARCLELGFAHGVASCYIAAALDEIGSGSLACVDIDDNVKLEPNLESLLEKTGLGSYVSICREKNSYTWFLKKEIAKNSVDYSCRPIYDLCFIDGPKNWTIDGLAFFLVDKLLNERGMIIFDDYNWRYCDYSRPVMDGISTRELSQDQIETPNIKLVFQLLVMQHPDYTNFTIDEDWAWARKVKSDKKYLRLEASQSFKYRLLKKLRSLKKLG